ncbi:MAG: hypothetical protein ACE5MI_11285 [Acidimicrobiia bacterium]
MDISVNLIESYLRINGYLTLSEFEVQRRLDDGSFETATDVDVVGLRFPGPIYAADWHDEPPEGRLLLIEDETLMLIPDCVDVIIGEVKEGDAVFNPALRNHEVLHTVLQRLKWIYAEPLSQVVSDLQDDGVSIVPTRGDGTIRTRLVAFGRTPRNTLHAISLTHVFRTMVSYMEDFDDVLRPAQFKDPAPALLRLLAKTGFSVEKKPAEPS